MASPFRVFGALLLAVVATGVTVTTGVVLHSPADEEPATRPLPTRLDSIDTATAVVRRGSFCDAVPPADARAAVDDPSPELSTWSNGDQLGSGQDVSHEFGCSWTAGSGAVASGWVFAPPVTVERAQELVASAKSQPGCTAVPGAAAYGSPSIALTCTKDGTTTQSYRGLFGDAWLVCELSGPRGADTAANADTADTADRWCASVLTAAGPAD